MHLATQEHPPLSAVGLVKSYGAKRAVSGVSLRVEPGKALGLLGPNGAGKSTTMLLIAGVLEPDQGYVEIAGNRAPSRASVRAHIGYAPQSLAVYENLTATENLTLFGRLHGLRGQALRSRVTATLELALLTDRAHHRVATFSGGMQRRLNLAMAVVHSPKLLLLDEPTVGVDHQSREHIFNCIQGLKQRGLSVIYSTHYLEEAARLCETIAIMDHGSILAEGSPDELVSRYGGSSRVIARMPSPPTDRDLSSHWLAGKLEFATDHPTEDIYRLLASTDTITDLSMHKPDLESVFVNLTGRTMRD